MDGVSTETFEHRGNPLEQIYAIGKNELSQSDVDSLVRNAGVAAEFGKLPPEKQFKVASGLFELWRVDQIGKKVENSDGEKFKGTELEYTAKTNLAEINTDFHNQVKGNWLDKSTGSLVRLASEKDDKRRKELEIGVVMPADEYTRRLQSDGIEYRDRIIKISSEDKRTEIGKYINDRDEMTREAKEIVFHGRLLDIVDDVSKSATSE